MMTDPIADMLIRIKNGYMARRQTVEVPKSQLKKKLALLLSKYKFIGEVTDKVDERIISIKLIYHDGQPALTEVTRVSKPGLRRYAKVTDLHKIKQALGYLILSTPNGLMTHVEAKKKGVGGEVICRIS